jgi:hypothetical protein
MVAFRLRPKVDTIKRACLALPAVAELCRLDKKKAPEIGASMFLLLELASYCRARNHSHSMING